MKSTTFKCEICGKEYETVEERAKCEMKCVGERAKAETKRKLEEMEAERARREAEVDAAFDKAYELEEKYIKDYGKYGHTYSNCECCDHDCEDDEEYGVSLFDLLRMLP